MGIAERALIRRIRAQSSNAPGVRVGIGDDCAVLALRANEDLLVTTDFSIEGVHFRREWQTARSIGQWCVTRGLSDVAAMGGRMVAVFLSLACPPGTRSSWMQAFTAGVRTVAEQYGASLAGGDTASIPERVVADIVVLGAVPKGRAVLRSGAKPGDVLYVTGALGRPHFELQQLLRGVGKTRRYLPQPQLAAGAVLRRFASAMIDVSDGLSTDLVHLADESSVTAVVDAERVPVARGASLDDALHGGDEYQLLFTAPPRVRVPRSINDVAVSRIGEIIRRGRHPVLLSAAGKLAPLRQQGWQHRF